MAIREEPAAAPAAEPSGRQRIIAVASGKGGVGKSNITINLGITLTRFGHRVMLVDGDMGMANLDLLLGVTPKFNLSHVLGEKKDIQEVLITGPSGIKILPASSGGRSVESVDLQAKKDLFDAIRAQHEIADLVLVDTGGGLSDEVMHYLYLADEIILVTTPEPTSIMDSYGIVKRLAAERESTRLYLIVNMANDDYDARHVVSTIEDITKHFFNVTVTDLGWIHYDPLVSRAVRQQQPFVQLYPSARASRAFNHIATRFANYKVDFLVEHGIRGLISRIRHFFT